MSSSRSGDEVLALVHQGWGHFNRQRPLAAWASWQQALRLSPGDEAASRALDFLASAEDLPLVARAVYRFRTTRDQEQRSRWDVHFAGRDLEDLSAAAAVFHELTDEDPDDAAAWYNRALCLAWEGANVPAIEALRRVVELQAADLPDWAAEAWSLGEILRQGAGAEPLADDLSHALSLEWHADDPSLSSLGYLRPVPSLPDGGLPQLGGEEVQAFEWLDRPMPEPGGTLEFAGLPRVLASIVQTPRLLRLSSPDPTSLAESEARLAQALADPDRPSRRETSPLPLSLLDADIWTFRVPPGLDGQDRGRLSRDAVEHYYENVWIHKSRQGLDGRSPLEAIRDAAGDAVVRAKLNGVILVREQLGARPLTASLYGGYPFDRLRRRLGLALHDSETVEPDDYACMSGEQLDQLEVSALDDVHLVDAYRSASGLREDARTARFAAVLASRFPSVLNRPGFDAADLFATLVRHALSVEDPEQALVWLDHAREVDAAADDSRRQIYDIWSAEVHARTGSPEAAVEIYRSLLEQPRANARLALDAAATLLDNGHVAHIRPLAALARDLARSEGDMASLARAEELLDVHP